MVVTKINFILSLQNWGSYLGQQLEGTRLNISANQRIRMTESRRIITRGLNLRILHVKFSLLTQWLQVGQENTGTDVYLGQ